MERYDENELRYIQNVGHFDESASVFLARQLTHVRAQVLRVKKAPLNAFTLFPVQTDIPEGAETAIQRTYDSVGIAEIISNYADDLPRVDLVAKEDSVKVMNLGDAYGWNEKEIKNAQFAQVNLTADKALAARRAMDVKINKIAFRGDAKHKIVGFLDNANISSYALPTDGTGSSTRFSDKTEDQVIRDVNNIIRAVPLQTHEVEQINTLAFAPTVYAYLATTRLSNTETTLLSFLQKVHPEVTRWMSVGELEGAGTAGKNMIIGGNFTPEYIKLEIPQRFQQLPVERRNLEYIVNCVASIVGVTVTMPLAFVKVEGA